MARRYHSPTDDGSPLPACDGMGRTAADCRRRRGAAPDWFCQRCHLHPGQTEAPLAYVYGMAEAPGEPVRYVGRSSATAPARRQRFGILSPRLNAHLATARAGDPRPVYEWLRSILGRGSRPHVVALRCCAVGAEGLAEREEIEARADQSPPLLNAA